ncbi:hypothetical protein D9M68_797110 [compost metagenome]
MVEQDTVAGIHAVGFAIVDRNPIGIKLGYRVGGSGIEGSSFLLGDFLYQAIEFRCGSLIEASFFLQPKQADSFQQAKSTHGIYVSGIFGRFETYSNVGLCSEIINFVGLYFLNDTGQI